MRRSALAATLLSAALLASACSGADGAEDGSNEEASPAVETAWAERESPDGAVQPRLVVSDAGGGTVTVIDVPTGEAVGTVQGTGPALLSAATPDGGLVYLVQPEDGAVQLLDAGIRYEAHGGHEDPAHIEPVLVEGGLEVPEPSHAVTGDGHTAVFADGDASVSVVHLEGEEAPATLEAEATVAAGEPHPGVAVPLGEHVATSTGDASGAAVGVRVLDADGAVQETFENCPDAVSGFAPDAETALFGCADGVLKVTADGDGWSGKKIDSPPASEEGQRVGALAGAPGQEVVLGEYSDDSVMLVDTRDDFMVRVEVPGTVGVISWDPYWGHGLVLTTDGQLHSVDANTKELAHSVQATGEFDADGENGGRAVVAAGENYLYVANPTTGELVEVAVSSEGLAVERNMLLDFTPRDMAVVGLAALNVIGEDSDGHDHEGEEEHDHEGEEGHDDGHDHGDEDHDHAEDDHDHDH